MAALILFSSASAAYADHQWGSYHWNKEGTDVLTLSVVDKHIPVEGIINLTPPDWSALLNDVVLNWDSPGGGMAGGIYLLV